MEIFRSHLWQTYLRPVFVHSSRVHNSRIIFIFQTNKTIPLLLVWWWFLLCNSVYRVCGISITFFSIFFLLCFACVHFNLFSCLFLLLFLSSIRVNCRLPVFFRLLFAFLRGAFNNGRITSGIITRKIGWELLEALGEVCWILLLWRLGDVFKVFFQTFNNVFLFSSWDRWILMACYSVAASTGGSLIRTESDNGSVKNRVCQYSVQEQPLFVWNFRDLVYLFHCLSYTYSRCLEI